MIFVWTLKVTEEYKVNFAKASQATSIAYSVVKDHVLWFFFLFLNYFFPIWATL